MPICQVFKQYNSWTVFFRPTSLYVRRAFCILRPLVRCSALFKINSRPQFPLSTHGVNILYKSYKSYKIFSWLNKKFTLDHQPSTLDKTLDMLPSSLDKNLHSGDLVYIFLISDKQTTLKCSVHLNIIFHSLKFLYILNYIVNFSTRLFTPWMCFVCFIAGE